MKLTSTTSFAQAVYAVVEKIPRGQVLTYKQVAKQAGRSKAHRAVGSILSKNQNPKIPCHRVIKSDGSVGRYNGLHGNKLALLKREGAIL
ncbi:MAG: MGMT family protein [Candidatus Kerfeldbacteria bacterium]|nr:MGMT family protein [Candidatus Kerfeldbacteria bacterium]